MLDLNHRLRSGKYAGQTLSYVYKKDRRYFNWMVENRPEMLRRHGSKPKVQKPKVQKPTYDEPDETKVNYKIEGISPSEAFD
jgi:hypothetical protein